uniref:Sun domain-containing protein 2 n=2 Tax=Tetraselmis sp. GSL018 TaxID=582737 RepID=A0A061RQ98_9CHLO
MGAKVVVANPEATRVGEVLKDDPDTYLKSECKSKDGQWLIIELAQVIKVEAITLSVTEMYSARLKTVQVLGHDGRLFGDAAEIAASRNSTDWRAVAVLSAENRRGLHVFMIPRRRWAKYLQFRFVEHYGNQKVCAINSIEIFG